MFVAIVLDRPVSHASVQINNSKKSKTRDYYLEQQKQPKRKKKKLHQGFESTIFKSKKKKEIFR
jgi:hypothetical protein